MDFDNNIGVSACLVGKSCRYDGSHCLVEEISNLLFTGNVIIVCPEELAGLVTPRDPAIIVGGTGEDVLDGKAKVMTIKGEDLTDAYIEGAKNCLKLLKENNIKTVIFKKHSPSCGFGEIISDFSGNVKKGNGVTVALLLRNGIKVMTEEDYLKSIGM